MKLPVLSSVPTPSRDFLESLPGGATTAWNQRRALPMSQEEARERGWVELDVVIVTGDAYIDHPSFAMAILGRVLEPIHKAVKRPAGGRQPDPGGGRDAV